MESSSAKSTYEWPLAFILAGGFALLVIRNSFATGALSLPPTYDDIGYFIDAARRLRMLDAEGVRAVLVDYVRQPPHAPLQTFLTMLGFGFFGVRHWAAVVINIVPIAIFLKIFYVVARPLPLAMSTIIATALLGFPLIAAAVLDVRPDMFAGLLTALGVVYITSGRWAASPRGPLLGGLLFGAALAAKLTIAQFTIGVFGLSLLLAIFTTQAHDLLKRLALTLGVAVAVALPISFWSIPGVLAHIYEGVFGPNAEIHALKLSLAEHALFYLIGPGGRFSMGDWLWIALLIGIGYGAILWRERIRGPVLATGIAIVGASVAISAPRMKTEFIGVGVGALFCVLAAVSIVGLARWLLDRGYIKLAYAGAIALLAFSIGAYQSPWAGRGRVPVPAQLAEAKRRMLDETVATLMTVPTDGRVVSQSVSAQYLTLPNIEFAFQQSGRAAPRFVQAHYDTSEANAAALIRQSDYILAFDPAADVIEWLPSAATRSAFLEKVRATGDFTLIKTVADPSGAGPLFIFARQRPAA
jgi:hypothetical protein